MRLKITNNKTEGTIMKENILKHYGIFVRNQAGTTVYMMTKAFKDQLEAFEYAKKEFAWFKQNPDIRSIVETIL